MAPEHFVGAIDVKAATIYVNTCFRADSIVSTNCGDAVTIGSVGPGSARNDRKCQEENKT
jgi:hypothetical protein